MTNGRPLSIPVILGTTRKGRMSGHVARFMLAQIAKRERVVTELIDISTPWSRAARSDGTVIVQLG